MAKKDEERFQKWYEEKWLPTLKPELHNSAKALYNDEDARQALMNDFLRQEDYTRKTQEVSKAREELDARVAAAAQEAVNQRNEEIRTWYEGANSQYLEMQKQLQQAKNTGVPAVEQNELKAQLEQLSQRLTAVDRGTFNSVVGMSQIAFRAAKDNLPFDPTKIIEISQKQNLPLDRAFNEFVAPELEARQKADFEKQLEEAKESGRREALSTRPTPDAMGNHTGSNPVLDAIFSNKSTGQKSSYDLTQEAVKEFYAAGNQG